MDKIYNDDDDDLDDEDDIPGKYSYKVVPTHLNWVVRAKVCKPSIFLYK